ncbi:hypothetical protein QEG73_04625 [Chitinophagaceae bacterium 26-R-25]|nr:hypothetical protein [Chitinophagaceae bacterium 26-R-25]
MKKTSFYLLATMVLSMTGCKKMYDVYIANPKAVQNICRIAQLTFYIGGNSAIYNISYDKNGNVTSMLTDKYSSAGRENFYFRYDKKNRLTDRLFVYVGNTGVVGWDSYIYFPDKIMDTSYYYAGYITDPHPPYDAWDKKWAVLNSDAHGRVSREIRFIPLSVTPTTNMFIDTVYYKYNKDGNLVFESPILPPVYDEQINPYLTNSMWQLVNRNYSVNNATDNFFFSSMFPEIVRYNAYGLPTKYIRPKYSGYRPVLFNIECDSLEIAYDCDMSKKNY